MQKTLLIWMLISMKKVNGNEVPGITFHHPPNLDEWEVLEHYQSVSAPSKIACAAKCLQDTSNCHGFNYLHNGRLVMPIVSLQYFSFSITEVLDLR